MAIALGKGAAAQSLPVTHFDALLASQDGVIRQEQLADAGVTRAALRWRLDSGRWRTLLPSVYLTVTGEPTPRQRLVAACLYAGPQVQVTGAAALRLHGLRELPDDPWIRVLVPHARQVASAEFVRVHRTRRMDPEARPLAVAALTVGANGRSARPGTPPPPDAGALTGEVCAVPRAVADASRWCTDVDPVRTMVGEALQARVATVAQLREELDHGPRAGGAFLRRVLDELAAEARSAHWTALHGVLADSPVLPPIRWQPTLVGRSDRQPLPRPAGWLDEVGTALEVDAREHRSGQDDWEDAMRRHNLWSRYGILVLYFSPKRIREDPLGVRREIEHAYLERLRARARATVEMLS
jgi:hypothetical protein